MQRRDQVRRVPTQGRRARGRPRRDRPLRAHRARRCGRLASAEAAPARKDQSYMLHMLGQSALARSVFPVGSMPKDETRAARRAVRPPGGDQARLPGALLRAERRRGRLRALAGPGPRARRRRGRRPRRTRPRSITTGRSPSRSVSAAGSAWRSASPRTWSTSNAPANRVTVGPASLLARRGLVADRASWVAGEAAADGPFEADVRIRYRGEDAAGGDRADPGRVPRRVPGAAARGGAGTVRRCSTGATRSSAAAGSCESLR